MYYLQLEQDSLLVRPLVAFCYGVELPPLKKGSKTEAQLRTLVDLYHANHYKVRSKPSDFLMHLALTFLQYHIPRLGATCEAALANLGDVVESPCKIGQKSPMHGVISRMLGHQREGRSVTVHEETGMCHTRRPVPDANPFEVERERREAIAMPEALNTSSYESTRPLNEYHLALLEEEHERRDSVVSDSSTTTGLKGKLPADARHSGCTEVEPERQCIAIPGVPHVARLRDRSPGGRPYSSPRLFDEIMAMLGSDGERSPMLYAEFPTTSRPVVERLGGAFHPGSPDAMTTAWSLSMSPPLLDNDFKPSEDTINLIPAPLRPSSKQQRQSDANCGTVASSSLHDPEGTLHLVPAPLRPSKQQHRQSKSTNGSGTVAGSSSSLYGPRPLPSAGLAPASQRSVTMPEDLATKTLANRPAQAAVKDGVFSSIRGATRRAFNGKAKR
ncbi:hypothetical protein BKA80DRAFT_285112 [Phyllosticta citrichinensis]